MRAREPGWREIRDGAIWARYFTGDKALAPPDSNVARELLRAALDPSKKEYLAAGEDWMRRLAPASARVRRDTIDIVGHSHIDAAWMWRWREGRDVVDATWATVTPGSASSLSFVTLKPHCPAGARIFGLVSPRLPIMAIIFAIVSCGT